MIGAFIGAALISLLLTPIVRAVARRVNLVDEPNHRRVNVRPIARGGGIAVVAGFLIVAVILTMLVASGNLAGFSLPASIGPNELTALLAGTGAAALIGLLDDILNLRARWQLLSQLVLAAVAVWLGITIDSIANPFGPGQIQPRRDLGRGVHDLLDHRDDQQHQLDRRPRRPVERASA